ncbi:MAG: HutD family protein [Rhodospirillales bacterium]
MSTVIRAADLPVSLWANSAGRKADIAIGEGWLLGFAWLEQDAPFSDYSGHDRTITLLEGPGFSLDLPAGSTLTVTERFQPTAFDGTGPMACHVRGPCRVLNAISIYPGWSHTVQTTSDNAPAGKNAFAVVLRGRIGDAGPLDTIPLTDDVTVPTDTLIAVIRFERDTDT